MEDAPKPINNSSINVEIKESNDKGYILTIINSFSVLKIYVEKKIVFQKLNIIKNLSKKNQPKLVNFLKFLKI